MPVTVELTPELESRLRREAAKLGLDPQAYVARALEQHLQRAQEAGANGNNAHVAALAPRESELLQQINAGLPADVWAQYRDLLRKRTDGTLTAAEQQALIALSDQIENANATRMARVAELARLRGVALETLTRELGLPGGPRA